MACTKCRDGISASCWPGTLLSAVPYVRHFFSFFCISVVPLFVDKANSKGPLVDFLVPFRGQASCTLCARFAQAALKHSQDLEEEERGNLRLSEEEDMRKALEESQRRGYTQQLGMQGPHTPQLIDRLVFH